MVRETLVTEGVDLEEEIVMQTTTGGTQTDWRAGIVRFDVDGVPAQLTLFTSSDTHELFLPFPGRDEREGDVRGRAISRGGAPRHRLAGRRGPQLRVQPLLRLQPRLELSDPPGRELARRPDPRG